MESAAVARRYRQMEPRPDRLPPRHRHDPEVAEELVDPVQKRRRPGARVHELQPVVGIEDRDEVEQPHGRGDVVDDEEHGAFDRRGVPRRGTLAQRHPSPAHPSTPCSTALDVRCSDVHCS
jgi:hypothetical protein